MIVVQSPEPRLFDQAIFILRDEVVKEGVTDEALMKEARQLINAGKFEKKRNRIAEMIWAGVGAVLIGSVWLATALF